MGSKIWRAAAAAAWGSVAINVHAATNAWTPLGPEGGGIVRVVYSPTPGTVFLIATGGFYRSQDSGVSWQPIYSGFSNAAWDLAVDPADSSRVYVIAPNSPSLYVSTDGGSTLAPSATFPSAVANAEAIAVSRDGTTLYASSANQLYRSTDRGQTWSQRTPFLSTSTIVERLLVDPTDSNTVYVVQANSATVIFILVTHDGGTSWARLSASANNSSGSTTAINAAATVDSPAPSKSGGGILSPWDHVGLMPLWASYVRLRLQPPASAHSFPRTAQALTAPGPTARYCVGLRHSNHS